MVVKGDGLGFVAGILIVLPGIAMLGIESPDLFKNSSIHDLFLKVSKLEFWMRALLYFLISSPATMLYGVDVCLIVEGMLISVAFLYLILGFFM